MRYYRSVPEQNDNLMNFIASTVEGLRGQVESISERMATRDDLSRLESQMATRIDALRDQTKDDIARLESSMATKVDLARVESNLDRVESNLDRVESKLETKVTALRGDIEQVQLRLDSIDHAVSTRVGMVETEVSRLRSVVYLLVKDNPDMLRLLG
jgi:chromosome segregation ATPase